MPRSEVGCQPLTAQAFAPFGNVLEASGTPDKIINAGKCGRYHDREEMGFSDARSGFGLFLAEPRSMPYTLDLMERHPEGSQAFVPMSENPFLVTVAPDEGGQPGTPLAFMTAPGQGVNIHCNTWHGVLNPLHAPGFFAVMDRIGKTPNLEEFFLDPPYIVVT